MIISYLLLFYALDINKQLENFESDQQVEKNLIDPSENKIDNSRKAMIIRTISLLKTSKMIILLPLIAYSGMHGAFIGGLLTKLVSNVIETKEEKLLKSLYCLFIRGFGESSFSIILARIIDKYKCK